MASYSGEAVNKPEATVNDKPPSSLAMVAEPVAEGAKAVSDTSSEDDVFWKGTTPDKLPCCYLFGCIPLKWPVRLSGSL